MKERKAKNVFMGGAISSQFIGESIAKHQSKTTIGAHNIFLGQVRADEVDGKQISAIDYTAHQEMVRFVCLFLYRHREERKFLRLWNISLRR